MLSMQSLPDFLCGNPSTALPLAFARDKAAQDDMNDRAAMITVLVHDSFPKPSRLVFLWGAVINSPPIAFSRREPLRYAC
jgi:hypothetical protein